MFFRRVDFNQIVRLALFVSSVPARHPRGGFTFCCTCNTCMETDNYTKQSSGSVLQSDFGKRESEKGGKMKAEINEMCGAFCMGPRRSSGGRQWKRVIHHLWCAVVNRHEARAGMNTHKVKCAQSSWLGVSTAVYHWQTQYVFYLF